MRYAVQGSWLCAELLVETGDGGGSMKKSGYIQKQKQQCIEMMTAQKLTTAQFMIDLFTVTLNDPAYMGSDAFGYDRIRRIIDGVRENYDAYFEAMTLSQEADYYRAKLDEALQRIIRGKEDFQPFEQRYPYLPEIRYTK